MRNAVANADRRAYHRGMLLILLMESAKGVTGEMEKDSSPYLFGLPLNIEREN